MFGNADIASARREIEAGEGGEECEERGSEQHPERPGPVEGRRAHGRFDDEGDDGHVHHEDADRRRERRQEDGEGLAGEELAVGEREGEERFEGALVALADDPVGSHGGGHDNRGQEEAEHRLADGEVGAADCPGWVVEEQIRHREDEERDRQDGGGDDDEAVATELAELFAGECEDGRGDDGRDHAARLPGTGRDMSSR